jgi:hypothetical protein
MDAMSERMPPRPTLPPEDFCLSARAILGPNWRRALAADLGLTVAMVDSWADGRVPVPYIVVKTLAALAKFRGEDLLRVSERLSTDLDGWIREP